MQNCRSWPLPGYSGRVPKPDSRQLMADVGARARAAEQRGDDALAGKEWRRFRLIQDAHRDPDELLAEGIALSVQAIELASASN